MTPGLCRIQIRTRNSWLKAVRQQDNQHDLVLTVGFMSLTRIDFDAGVLTVSHSHVSQKRRDMGHPRKKLAFRRKPFAPVCIYCATSASELYSWVPHNGKKYTRSLPHLHVKPGLCMEGMNDPEQRTIGFSTAFNGS